MEAHTLLPRKRHITRLAERPDGCPERLGHMEARTTMGYTHLRTADDVRIAGELGALLDKEFFVQDLSTLSSHAEAASERIRKPFRL